MIAKTFIVGVVLVGITLTHICYQRTSKSFSTVHLVQRGELRELS